MENEKRERTAFEESRELSDKIDTLKQLIVDSALKDWLAFRAKVGYFRGL